MTGDTWKNSMTKSAQIAVAAILLLGGTSLATAQNSQPTDGFRGVTGGADGNHFRPGKRPTAANQYYGLFDDYAVPHTIRVTPTATYLRCPVGRSTSAIDLRTGT
jgi:hypothetical protein